MCVRGFKLDASSIELISLVVNLYLIYDLIWKSQLLLVLLYNVVLLPNVPVLCQLSSHHQVFIVSFCKCQSGVSYILLLLGSTTPVTQQQRASKTPSSAPMSRTSSTYRPKQTATVRARAERAKAQQQEIEERKQKAAQLNNVSLRLKQQAKSTIDWDAIKKERRRTMPVMPSTK